MASPPTHSSTSRDVLIVESDEQVREELRQCLAPDIGVHFAATAEEGEALLRIGAYRLLICADDLPDRSGLMLLASTQDLWPSMQRVLLCNVMDAEMMLLALKDGQVFHYLPKPIDHEASRTLLAHAIEQHRMAETLIQTRRRLDAAEVHLQTLRLPEDTTRGPGAMAGWRIFVWSALALLTLLALALAGFAGFYFFKSSLGVDFFPDSHLEDFLPP